jgi:DNA-binding GntR family transcriptional regulator
MVKQNNVFKEAFNRYVKTLRKDDELPAEPEIAQTLGISRSTARAILVRLSEENIILWQKQKKVVLRDITDGDLFPMEETHSLHRIIEKSFMQLILSDTAQPGMQINELELARTIGVGTTSVREFLIRFSRYGLIEKRPNSHWVLKGFTTDFALELANVRDMFELHSAAEFAALPDDNPLWNELDAMEAEHRDVLDNIDAKFGAFSPLDERFHLMIHRASSNRFILDFYDVIAMVFHYHYQWNRESAKQRNRNALEEHLAYISALKSRDPAKAVAACKAHLSTARQTLITSMTATVPDAAS